MIRHDYGSAKRPRGGSATTARSRSQSGDTLVEVLIAVMVVGLCGVALLVAFSTSLTASSEYRSLSAIDAVVRSASETALALIQQRAVPQFSSCANSTYYTSNIALGAPSGFTAIFTSVQYWTGSGFSTTCPAGSYAPQLLTIEVTGPSGARDTNSFVVTYPTYSSTALAGTPMPTSGI